jgi:hypothetical protein
MTTTCGLGNTSSSLMVLRLYNILQPVTRHALVTLAHAPGGWAHDSQSQIVTMNELIKYLNRMILSAQIKGLSVTHGEPYTGFNDTACHRWLPALAYGALPTESPHLLLASPPLFSFNNIDAFFCTHVSVTSWHSFLARRQPGLALKSVPLFGRPSFPNPWTSQLANLADVAEVDNDCDDWMTGEEAVMAIISWVGRVVLTRFVGDDQALTIADAREAIDLYQGARSNIVHTIDSILHGIIAHSIFRPSVALGHAIKFITSTLECMAKTGKNCSVLRGRNVSQVIVNATQWLPGVSYLVPKVEDPSVVQIAD